MSVIVRTSFDNAKQYKGKGVSTKVGNKNHNVFFKVIIDDFTIEEALKNNDSNIIMYEYQGTTTNPIYLGVEDTDLYITKSYEFGNDISESDIEDLLNRTPNGIVPIIKLPEDFKGFEFVCRMCDKYPRVRFCGGIMFCADGCRVGCCGRDVLDNAGIKYKDSNYIKEGCACSLDIISDEGLELEVSEKKTKVERKSKSSSCKSSSRGTKKQKTKMFGDFLGGFNLEL